MAIFVFIVHFWNFSLGHTTKWFFFYDWMHNNWYYPDSIFEVHLGAWVLQINFHIVYHGLRTPREEIAFTARPKIQSQSQFFRYGGSIFCLPHRPNFSDIFDLCLHWVSVVRVVYQTKIWNHRMTQKCLEHDSFSIFFLDLSKHY